MTGPREGGKIHYLKTAAGEPPQTESFGQLIRRLEDRLDRLEREVRDTVRGIERHEGVREGIITSELTSLVKNLEGRIKQVTDEIRSGRVQGEARSRLQAALVLLHKLLRLVSFREFKNLLSHLWFGPPEESLEFDDFGMDPAFARRAKPFFNFLYYQYWRVKPVGIQNVPSSGRGLLVSNHSGTLPWDGAMIRLAIDNDHPSRPDVRFLVEDFVYHFPFLGTFMYRTGGVRACQENAERLLMNDFFVAVFPEGVKGIGKHFKNRYRLQRFGRGGFIKLALKTGSPIIPVAVIGAEEIHPILYKSTVLARPLGIPYLPVTPTLPWLGLVGLIPLPTKWTIYFGEPLLFHKKYGPKEADDQLLVNRLSEQVRIRIQEMIVEGLKSRRSIWFG